MQETSAILVCRGVSCIGLLTRPVQKSAAHEAASPVNWCSRLLKMTTAQVTENTCLATAQKNHSRNLACLCSETQLVPSGLSWSTSTPTTTSGSAGRHGQPGQVQAVAPASRGFPGLTCFKFRFLQRPHVVVDGHIASSNQLTNKRT